MEIDEARLLAALRSCHLGPEDRISLRDVVTRSFDSLHTNLDSERSEEIHPTIGKVTEISAHWKLKENGFGHHLYLDWLPPDSIDSEIDSYHVNINNSIFETKSSIPEFEVDILDPESLEYRVRILAACRNDLGPFSEWVVAKELEQPPAPPNDLRCIERHCNSLKFWWGDKKSDKIFTLEMRSGNGCFKPVYSGPSLSFKVEDLVPDTEYEIRICASNLAGEAGPYSDVFTFSTSHLVPHTVRTLKALTMMEINWRTWYKNMKLRIKRAKKLPIGAKKYSPVILKLLLKARKHRPSARKYPLRIRKCLQRKKPPLSRFSIDFKEIRRHTQLFPPRARRTSPAARKCNICNLDIERIHRYNIQHGLQLQRQVPVLRAVRDVSVFPLIGGVHIKWLKPLVTDYCSFSYNVIMDTLSFNTNNKDREIAIKGLDPDASYRIQIQAVSCDGPGPLSEVIVIRTRPSLPGPLQMQCVETGYNHLRLHWFWLDEKRNDIISYCLEMRVLKSFEPVYHGPKVNSRVMLLEGNTEYKFRVCAFTQDGKGQYSDVYKFRTSSSPDTLNSSNKIVDQDDHSSVNMENVASTSKVMKQSAIASEVLEQTASAFELIGQTAIASEIKEQVYPTPKTENQVPVMDQADPSSVMIEQVTPVSKAMEQTAIASKVTKRAVTVFRVTELTISLSDIMEQMNSPPEAEKQVALRPSSLLRSTEDENDLMDEKDDDLSRKKPKKNSDCILIENCCKFYDERIHLEEEQMDTFMNYVQELMISDAARERFYICPSSCFGLLAGLSHTFLNKTIGEEMLHHASDLTVQIDLFKKDVIVIPILMNHQWSMVIICYPGLIPQTPESAKRTELLKLLHFRFSRDRGVSSNDTVHGDKKGRESSTSKKSTGSAENAQQAKVPCLYIFPVGSNHDSSVIAIRLKKLLEQQWKRYKGTERVLDLHKLDIFVIDFSGLATTIDPEMKLLHITAQFLKQTNEGAKCKKRSKVPKFSGISTKDLHMLHHIICEINVLQRPSATTGLKTMDKETEKTSESGGSTSKANIKNPVHPSNLNPFYDYFNTEAKDTLPPSPPPPLDLTAKKLLGYLHHITSRDIPYLAEWNPDTISQFKESLNWC